MMFRNALIQTTDSHASVIIAAISILCESYMKLLLIIQKQNKSHPNWAFLRVRAFEKVQMLMSSDNV